MGWNLQAAFELRRTQAKAEIDAMPADELLAADAQSVARQVAERSYIKSPVLGSKIQYVPPPWRNGGDAFHVKIMVPFEGDALAFTINDLPWFRGTWTDGQLFGFNQLAGENDIHQIPARAAQVVVEMGQELQKIARIVEQFNGELLGETHGYVNVRRFEMGKYHAALEALRIAWQEQFEPKVAIKKLVPLAAATLPEPLVSV